MDVLVGHATVHGSTRSLAERIGARPGGHGSGAGVGAVAGVAEPAAYGASVLGSAVHGRVVFRLMGCRHGDFRDRAAVDAWAGGIAAGPAER